MNEILSNDYLDDLKKIKETIRTNQNKAMVVVNSAMIMTYYEIGTIINKRKTWGSKYIQKLSEDLKEYGKGYSYGNLKYMAQFASNFSCYEISEQPARQIPWFTIIKIMQRSKSHEEMIWYINETYKNNSIFRKKIKRKINSSADEFILLLLYKDLVLVLMLIYFLEQ